MDHSTDQADQQIARESLLLHPLLDRAAEQALFHQLDQDAIAEIARCNQRLVRAWALHYATCGLDLDDLHQAGNEGLLRAIGKFDPSRGFRFSTYATLWIRQSIVRMIAEQGHTIRRPVHIIEKLAKLGKVRTLLMRELGRMPTAEEYAAALGWNVGVVERLLCVPETRSLDAPLHPDTPRRLADRLPDDAPGPEVMAIRTTEAARLHQALMKLPSPERDVLRLRFGLDGAGDRTLKEVGDSYAKTREWARLAEQRGLDMLRSLIAA